MPLRAAVLGTGRMSRVHAASLKELGIPVTAVCNANLASAQAFKAEMGIKDADIYQDFDKMLESGDFNILFICIPPFAQQGQFEKASAQGKHIFIEKPIALNSLTGSAMVRSAKQNGIINMVGFHQRYGAAVKRLKELIDKGEAGRPVLFSAELHENITKVPWWWIKAELSGGQLFEQGAHYYDLCRYFFGDPKYAAGFFFNACHCGVPGYSADDVSACIASFKSGALANITTNNCASRKFRRITIVFEKLTAELSDYNHGTFTFCSQEESPAETVAGEEDPFFEEVKEFVSFVESGKQTGCDILEGYKSLCFSETAVRSAKLDGVKLPVEIQF